MFYNQSLLTLIISLSLVLQIFAVWSAADVATMLESGLNLTFSPYFLCAGAIAAFCWSGTKEDLV